MHNMHKGIVQSTALLCYLLTYCKCIQPLLGGCPFCISELMVSLCLSKTDQTVETSVTAHRAKACDSRRKNNQRPFPLVADHDNMSGAAGCLHKLLCGFCLLTRTTTPTETPTAAPVSTPSRVSKAAPAACHGRGHRGTPSAHAITPRACNHNSWLEMTIVQG